MYIFHFVTQSYNHEPPYVQGDAVYIAIKNTGICGEEEIIR
jgi:hypothetical protein